MADLSCLGSSQQTSEEEDSESPAFPCALKVQKKPARPCLKHLEAIADESDSAASQVTTESSVSESPGTLPKSRAPKRKGSSSETSGTKRSRVANSRAPKRRAPSSETSETKRIKKARQDWQNRPKKSRSKPSATKESESSTQETSDSSDAMDDKHTDVPKPASSGMLDYCSWMVDQLSDEERKSAAANWWQTFAEFCAGMGTGIIGFEGLRKAMGAHHLRVNASCACLTEKVLWKAKALEDLLGCLDEQTSPCSIFLRTGDLNNSILTDINEEVVAEKPTFHLLMMGIVCIDISALTTTPKSLADPVGESGRSWRELTQYLESLEFQDRPEGIILECVLRLSHKRQIKGLPEPEVGTQLVSAALRALGYVGSWEKEDAKKSYLPQSRPRIWGIFLKVKMRGPNPLEAERKRAEDVSRAFSIVKRLKVPKYEPLQIVVGRLGLAPVKAKTKAKTQRPPNMDLGWTTRAAPQKNMKKLKITREDLLASEDLKAFWKETGTMMNQSCQRHALMRLASLRKRGKVPDWRETVLAFNADESAYRLGVGIMHFPCVQPNRLHIMALNGTMVKADGQVCLAMQGIQSKELNAFPSLSKQSSKRQQDWAGNAFTANTCAAHILAVAVVR